MLCEGEEAAGIATEAPWIKGLRFRDSGLLCRRRKTSKGIQNPIRQIQEQTSKNTQDCYRNSLATLCL